MANLPSASDELPVVGERSSDVVRSCPLCTKPFNLISSYNRHLSYCRRSQSRPKTRQRSCRACSVAKAKCSFTSPCSRCAAKGLDCIYDHRSSQTIKSTCLSPNAETQFQTIQIADTLLPEHGEVSVTGFHSLEDSSNIEFNGFEGVDNLFPDASGLGSDGLEMMMFGASEPETYHYIVDEIQSPSILELAAADDYDGGHVTKIDSTTTLGFLTRLSSPRSLVRQGANLLIESLCAIPEQMLRRSTFPTFIHPHWDPLVMPEPLAVCMQIARLFASRTPEIRPFIWRTILAEHKRVLKDLHNFSKQDLLAIIQAHMVYLVMRVVDRGPGSGQWNWEMIKSLNMICDRFLFLCKGSFSEDEKSHPSSSWEGWIFAESRRRTACVWFLITRTIVVKTLAGCPTTEQPWTLPLPSPKTQWEARSLVEWMEEIDIGSPAIQRFGDLLESRKRCNEVSNAQLLDSWNASTDNLGSLLNIAAAMM